MWNTLAMVFGIGCLPLPQEDETDKATVAVLKFNLNADKKKFTIKYGEKEDPVDALKASEALYDHFVTTLVKSGRFNVVERAKIDEILKQQQLNDLTNADDAKKAGEMLGSQYLFQGSVTMLTANVTERDVPDSTEFATRTTEAIVIMDLRIMDSANGKVVFATSHKQPVKRSRLLKKGGKDAIDGDVNSVISEGEHLLVKELVRKVIDNTFPIKVISQKEEMVYVNRGKDGLKVGDELLVIVEGEELLDPDSGKVIGREETEIARIKVFDVQPKFSKAKIVEWKSETKEIAKGALCRRITEHSNEGDSPKKPKIGD